MRGARGALIASAMVCLGAASGCGTAGISRAPETVRPGAVRTTPRVAGKPGVPVTAALEMIGKALLGAPVRFRLTVKPEIHSSRTFVDVMLPAGAAVTDGTISWAGPLRAGQEKILEFTVVVPDAVRYAITADVVVAERKGATLKKRVVLDVDLGSEKGLSAAPKASDRHKAVRLEDFVE